MKREMAVVCCYFNPCHYRRRLQNYFLFRMNITRSPIELLTVELAFGDDAFELDGVPNVIQRRAADTMWQKERLLNIGLEALVRQGYSKLAWLDADILFDDPENWAHLTSDMLDRFPLIQVYDRVARQDGEGQSPRNLPGSVAHYRATGVLNNWPGLPGFGWAVRTEVFQAAQLYDAAILGGADGLIHCASYCNADVSNWFQHVRHIAAIKAINPPMLRHWITWAKRWGRLVDGNVHFAPQGITALYHGTIQDRQYISRAEILARHQFDPIHDIACNNDGCWQWATTKPGLHAEVREYFRKRNEDN